MTTFKNISDGEYMRDKISCLRSYFNNFSTLLQPDVDVAHGWLLGKKRKCTGSDPPDAKRIRLDSVQLESGAGRGKGGGKGAGGKRGKASRNGDGRGPASGKKKNASGGK
jgi:hypothetical protein